MGLISTLLIVMVLGDAAWWWWADRLLRRHATRWRWPLAIFFAAHIGGLGLVLLSRNEGLLRETSLPQPLVASVYIWHCLVLLPLLAAWVLYCVARAAVLIVRRIRRSAASTLPPTGPELSRRQFLGAAVATAPALLTLSAAATGLWQLRQFRVRRLEVALAQLPPALDGLTIAHVSDLHVGRFTRGAVLEEIVRATNDLRADLVLLTGDLINFALSDLPEALEAVGAMRGTHGVFMCEGNHDLFQNAREFRRRTTAASVGLLVNESTVIPIRGEAVQLLGLRWGRGGVGDPHAAAQRGDAAIAASAGELAGQRRSGAFPILLAHHPHVFDFTEAPLTLAGHTHGGQLMLNSTHGFGPLLFRYWSGLYRRGDRALVVSNGTGNWFPLRTAAPAEVLHLTLRTRSGKSA